MDPHSPTLPKLPDTDASSYPAYVGSAIIDGAVMPLALGQDGPVGELAC